MSEDALRNGYLVFDLASTALADARALDDAPRRLRKVLEAGAWQHFTDPYSSKVFEYRPDEFEKFARAKRPAGLELPEGIKTLISMCEPLEASDADAQVAVVRLRELVPKAGPAIHAGPGRGKKTGDNVTRLSQRGNSDTYLLRRLKRDHPELAAKVVAGEMTAHAAAIEAGYRVRVVQITPTVIGFTLAIQKHLSAEERQELKGTI